MTEHVKNLKRNRELLIENNRTLDCRREKSATDQNEKISFKRLTVFTTIHYKNDITQNATKYID